MNKNIIHRQSRRGTMGNAIALLGSFFSYLVQAFHVPVLCHWMIARILMMSRKWSVRNPCFGNIPAFPRNNSWKLQIIH